MPNIPTKAQWDKWIAERVLPIEQDFWVPSVDNGKPVAHADYWYGGRTDRAHMSANMVCRTKREAIAKARKMLEAIR